MHYLVTGHTGFKGSWLILLLTQLGHTVSGIALEPDPAGLFVRGELRKRLRHHTILDIRDRDKLRDAIRHISPDVVIHMAAQPLVIESYKNPTDTFDTNVTGTLNLLLASSATESIRAVLVVTTDKVYADTGSGAYSESSALGGFDPYSTSKAMADLLTQSWMNLGQHYRLGVARAGNVVGLGDTSDRRLLPDIVSAIRHSTPLDVRSPESVRPWQHVLDCLSGYLLFVDYMLKDEIFTHRVLNFGPDPEGYKSVSEVVAIAQSRYSQLEVNATSEPGAPFKETQFLTLDSTLARSVLGWENRIEFSRAVDWSLDGIGVGSLGDVALGQIRQFSMLATEQL